MNDFSQKLNLLQGQTMVMTPQLQQAIKLLQLNNLELGEFVEQQLEENPFLERDDKNPDNAASEDPPPEKTETDDVEREFAESYQENSTDYSPSDNTFSGMQTGSGGSFNETDYSFENRLKDTTTLRDHLTTQLFIECSDQRDRLIGGLLIDQLDEAGYLRHDIKELAETLGCSEERITKLLEVMKRFDPTGIFSADLKECLSLQLAEKNQLDAHMKTLLDHLDLIANHDYKALEKICGANETYIRDMVEEIQSLNPRPASAFDHFVAQTVIPDILMRRLPKTLGGGWRVDLNNETLPRVLVNEEYFTLVNNQTKAKQDQSYLKEKLSAANWLIKAMDQRAHTVLKVSSAIIDHQEAFFNFGIEFLKPLTLKTIAEEIEMHESTVSRVTNNKYIETPRGVFELKFFFSSGLGGGGGDLSSEAIKAKIRTLIDAENPKKILSDDKIVENLKTEGIDIARRTVAKYREAMNIPSSVQRRKQKNRP